MSRKSVIVPVAIVVSLVVLAAGGVYVTQFRHQPALQPENRAMPITSPTPLAVPTLPPPLANVQFPTKVASYPPEWPADLRYPAEFSVVDTSSGTVPGGSKGWAAKLRYQGDAKTAAGVLSSFFTTKGWQVAERTELDSGGVFIVVKRDNSTSSGMAVIDPDAANPGYTKVVATVFP